MDFKYIDKKYRPIPFWSWNDKINVDETLRQTKIMDEAMALGMYASVTGNKGWQPTNEDYTSLFLNSWAGGETVYKALTDQISWDDPALVEAIEASAEWYQKGYLCSDYFSIGWGDAAALLATGQSPFYFGPLRFTQNLKAYDVGDSIGFAPFPTVGDTPSTVTVGATVSAIANVTMPKNVWFEASKGVYVDGVKTTIIVSFKKTVDGEAKFDADKSAAAIVGFITLTKDGEAYTYADKTGTALKETQVVTNVYGTMITAGTVVDIDAADAEIIDLRTGSNITKVTTIAGLKGRTISFVIDEKADPDVVATIYVIG